MAAILVGPITVSTNRGLSDAACWARVPVKSINLPQIRPAPRFGDGTPAAKKAYLRPSNSQNGAFRSKTSPWGALLLCPTPRTACNGSRCLESAKSLGPAVDRFLPNRPFNEAIFPTSKIFLPLHPATVSCRVAGSQQRDGRMMRGRMMEKMPLVVHLSLVFGAWTRRRVLSASRTPHVVHYRLSESEGGIVLFVRLSIRRCVRLRGRGSIAWHRRVHRHRTSRRQNTGRRQACSHKTGSRW